VVRSHSSREDPKREESEHREKKRARRARLRHLSQSLAEVDAQGAATEMNATVRFGELAIYGLLFEAL
jgi:hypothetical protein